MREVTAEAKASLDITNDVCPITFVKTKLKLEELEPGEVLEVILKSGEPLANVPRSAKQEGHKILKVEQQGENFRLLIRKGE